MITPLTFVFVFDWRSVMFIYLHPQTSAETARVPVSPSQSLLLTKIQKWLGFEESVLWLSQRTMGLKSVIQGPWPGQINFCLWGPKHLDMPNFPVYSSLLYAWNGPWRNVVFWLVPWVIRIFAVWTTHGLISRICVLRYIQKERFLL